MFTFRCATRRCINCIKCAPSVVWKVIWKSPCLSFKHYQYQQHTNNSIYQRYLEFLDLICFLPLAKLVKEKWLNCVSLEGAIKVLQFLSEWSGSWEGTLKVCKPQSWPRKWGRSPLQIQKKDKVQIQIMTKSKYRKTEYRLQKTKTKENT